MRTVGVDIGSQKSSVVVDDAEIIRTSTGSIATPTMLSFLGNQRLAGEEALPQTLSNSTICLIDQMIRPFDELSRFEVAKYMQYMQLSADEKGRTVVQVLISCAPKHTIP